MSSPFDVALLAGGVDGSPWGCSNSSNARLLQISVDGRASSWGCRFLIFVGICESLGSASVTDCRGFFCELAQSMNAE